METRMNLQQVQPQAWKAMYGLETAVAATNLATKHKELIKIRASQINGCGFCLDMHTKEALKSGETAQRIFLLNAWRESELFTEEEKAILELTESVTLISHQGVPDSIYQKAAAIFDTNYIASIIMAIVAINAWNRIAVSTGMKS